MNEILMQKIDQLDSMSEFECWYLVKHNTDFKYICYACACLEICKENDKKYSNEYSAFVRIINEEKNIKLPDNYRMIRVACFYGLITPYVGAYENAELTDSYYEIKKRCNGNFENTDLYYDIIQRQLEKIYMSSEVDEECNNIRNRYRIFPVIYLYKILLEIGRATKYYQISMNEYRYLVATSAEYKDFLLTLLEIKLLRQDNDANTKFETYRTKFDNRFILALKQLKTLDITKDFVKLNDDYINEVAEKVYRYETNPRKIDKYTDYLGSTQDMLIKDVKETNIDMKDYKSIEKPHNRIFVGAPGTGKSYNLDEERKLYFDDNYKRVTFYPNYSYAQFVGTYKPSTGDDGDIVYEYVPGPFVEMWINAYNSNENFLLIIEEINRANAAAVFGDLFQLLDRDENGNSIYKIDIPIDMKKYLLRQGIDIQKLSIPQNLYIWSTMNSSDQGVSPLDSAFKRRFEFDFVGIDQGDSEIEQYTVDIVGLGNLNWNRFRKGLNKYLTENNIREDKLIGPFFIKQEILRDNDKFQNAFVNKLIFYLAEDVFKHKLTVIFKEKSLSKIYDHYKLGINIFSDEFTLENEE